jgi:secretion/DNA translocation related TadE-like protein
MGPTPVAEARALRPDRRRRSRTADGGYATVWVVAAIAVVVVAGSVATGFGAAVVERHRAAAAADAVALEVAVRSIAGRPAACRSGAAIAQLNGAMLRQCGLHDGTAEVVVEVRLRGMLSVFGSAEGRARAGPASEGIEVLSSPSTP